MNTSSGSCRSITRERQSYELSCGGQSPEIGADAAFETLRRALGVAEKSILKVLIMPDGFRFDKSIVKRLWEPFFLICLAVFFALNAFLFYNQAFAGVSGRYFADMADHLSWASYTDTFLNIPSQARAYPLFHLTVRAFSVFFDTEMSGALATASYNALSAILVYLVICGTIGGRNFKLKLGSRERDITRALPTLLTFALLTCSMLILPINTVFGGEWHMYLGVFTPNPWHNPTHLAARPFAIACVVLFGRLISLEDGEFKPAPLIAFSLALALATFAKPSFAAVFLPVAGLMLLVKLFGKRRRRALAFGAAFIPTFALLLWQYSQVFDADSLSAQAWGGGLSLDFGWVWSSFCACIPLAIILAGAFGIFVFASRARSFKELPALFRVSVYLYICSILEALVFRAGDRALMSGDFFWGYMYALFFLFLAAILLLLTERGDTLKKNRKAAWALFALHTLCGVGYFAWALTGRFYQ